MKIRLRVNVDGPFWNGGAVIDVPDLVCQHFEPLKTCDLPFVANLLGEMTCEEGEAIIAVREDAAEILAKEISRMIVSEMSKNDTHNGYKVENDFE